MHYNTQSDLWLTFSKAEEEWSSNYKADNDVAKYNPEQVRSLVHDIASSVDKEPTRGQFSAHFFCRYARHLHLQQAVEGKFVEKTLKAIEALWSVIGNHYNFDVKSEVVKRLLDIGANICSVYKLPQDENIKYMAESAKRLSKIATGIKVSKGSLEFDETFSREIFHCLDVKMARLGGMAFLARYEKRGWMAQRYCSELDRYMFCRQDYTGERLEPIQFLLNLAARHLSGKTAQSLVYRKDLHDEIIQIATDFLEICDLQDMSGISYAMMRPEDIAFHIADDMFFYKMCIPVQYSARFILSAMDYLIKPWFDDARKKYNYRDYRAVSAYFLKQNWWENNMRFLTLEELHYATRVAKYKLIEMLKDISIPISEINKHFISFDSSANFFEYPLLYNPSRGYCCFDRLFCGYGFLKCIHKIIKSRNQNLDSLQGYELEKWLAQEMKVKGYDIKSGHYPAQGGLNEGECDFVMESSRIYFFELKKKEIIDDFNDVDDVKMWGTLGQGMLRAQKQCFSHELYLMHNGTMVFDTGASVQFALDKIPAVKISVCFGEHFFISSKAYVMVLLKTILKNGEILARDTSRQKILDGFNRYSHQIVDIIRQQNAEIGKVPTVNEIVACSLFCSMQQILLAIWITSDEREFLNLINEMEIRADGSLDQYMILFGKLHHADDSISDAILKFAQKKKTPPLIVS